MLFSWKSWSLLAKNSRNRLLRSPLDATFISLRMFCNARKTWRSLGAYPHYMADGSKLPKQTPGVCGGSLLLTSVALSYPLHLSRWPILSISSRSLASNGPVVDSKDPNSMFGYMKATHNNSFQVPPNGQQNLPGLAIAGPASLRFGHHRFHNQLSYVTDFSLPVTTRLRNG